MSREADLEELAQALKKVREAWAGLDTSRRDWGYSEHDRADARLGDRPSALLHTLMSEQADEARRLYLAAADAADICERLGFNRSPWPG